MTDQPQLGPVGRPGRGLGCLGSIVGAVVVVAVIVAVASIGLVVLAVLAALVVVGLVVFAVDRLLLALSPKRRQRREDILRSWGMGGARDGLGGADGRGGSTGADQVIDTTATVEMHEPRPPAVDEDDDEAP